MTILNRDTLVDRPELVERGNEDDEEEEEGTQEIQTEVLGDGGGPKINNIVFEPGDYSVVAGANTAAVLASGDEEGEFYEQAFFNAAIQLKNLQSSGETIKDVARFGLEKGIAELNVSKTEIKRLQGESVEEDDVEVETVEEEEIDTPEQQSDGVDEDEDIDEIEEDLEDVGEQDEGDGEETS